MSNIEKKLDALINALGFDVEVIQTNIVSPPKNEREGFGSGIGIGSCRPAHIINNYKLTKRDEPVMPIGGIGQDSTNKPPIGIPPKSIHDGVREEEIISAMIRYLKAKKAVPDSWFTELYELQGAKQ